MINILIMDDKQDKIDPFAASFALIFQKST